MAFWLGARRRAQALGYYNNRRLRSVYLFSFLIFISAQLLLAKTGSQRVLGGYKRPAGILWLPGLVMLAGGFSPAA